MPPRKTTEESTKSPEMAPEARKHLYRVLDANGIVINGRSFPQGATAKIESEVGAGRLLALGVIEEA